MICGNSSIIYYIGRESGATPYIYMGGSKRIFHLLNRFYVCTIPSACRR